MSRIAIVAAKRTPMGAFMGSLSSMSAPKLASVAITAAMKQSKCPNDQIDEALFGNVVGAGIGQAPTRQAVLGADLPDSIPCTTVNKVCGSGLKAVMLAAQAIKAGDAEVIVAGGMESMSNAPYILPKARDGYRLGHGKLVDLIVHDGLWEAYEDFHMGNAAELIAEKYKVTREDQDEVQNMVRRHYEYTRSAKAEEVLRKWNTYAPKFVKVSPRDLKMVQSERMKAGTGNG